MPLRDPGVRFTDSRFDEIRDRVRVIYADASRDIIKKLDAHARRMNLQDQKWRAQVKAGKLTEEEYKQRLNGLLFTDKLWKDRLDSAASTLLDANRVANRIIEGERKAVFGENATYQAYRIESGLGADLSFTLYDSATVTRLLRDRPALLPVRKLSAAKDTAWNRKKIAAIITRGVISGATIPDIAAMIAEETGEDNEAACLRYARTAMTAAQNAGRMEAMREANERGVRTLKMWIATLDNRTRPAHQDLDGQVQPVERPFDSELGPIMYPGDPMADEANTWNCRCTLGYEYEEYDDEDAERYAYDDDGYGELIEDMSYSEWLQWKGD